MSRANEPIRIIDAGIGNVASVMNMIRHVGGSAEVVTDPAALAGTSKLVLPGVGSFDGGMDALDSLGFSDPIRAAAASGARLLGICLGMQLMFEGSEEGARRGLSLLPGRSRRFTPDDSSLKIPHMGWNAIQPRPHASLFGHDGEEERFYFVHSYHVECADASDVAATAHYGYEFACAVERDRLMGVQFHPEKSHRYGMAVFKRFLSL